MSFAETVPPNALPFDASCTAEMVHEAVVVNGMRLPGMSPNAKKKIVDRQIRAGRPSTRLIVQHEVAKVEQRAAIKLNQYPSQRISALANNSSNCRDGKDK
jgi:hypothetical protein